MNRLFLTILDMSVTAGLTVLAVASIRLLLKKAPKLFSYALWSAVLFRLICPFSFESAAGLLPAGTQNAAQGLINSGRIAAEYAAPGNDDIIRVNQPAADPVKFEKSSPAWLVAAEIIWISGIVLLVVYSLLSAGRLKKQLKGAANISKGVCLAANLQTPFVMGIFRPVIYLPEGLTKEEQTCILLHEQTHIHRGDHVIKPFSFLLLCIHWFNPLIWLAFLLMTKDMEMACDETALRKMGGGSKKQYSASLLALATKRRFAGGAPLAFGEGEVKERVKNVLRYKKPAFWKTAASLLIVAAAFVALAFDHPTKENPSFLEKDEKPLLLLNDTLYYPLTDSESGLEQGEKIEGVISSSDIIHSYRQYVPFGQNGENQGASQDGDRAYQYVPLDKNKEYWTGDMARMKIRKISSKS